MSKEIETRIGRYTVTFSTTIEDGEERTQCFIEYGRFSASLESADATGELNGRNDDDVYIIDSNSLAIIRKWAESVGY